MKTTKSLVASVLLGLLLSFSAHAFESLGWQQLPGGAKDVGVGANGVAWVTGTDSGIYRWTGSAWANVPGAAVRIAVGPEGNPWVVNSAGNIFSGDASGNWTQQPGGAKDVGVGANGAVWITGTDSGIYRWTGNGWTRVPGGAERISVDPAGNPWVVNSAGNIFSGDASGNWTMRPGAARDIGVGAKGAVFIIGTDRRVYRWTGSDWVGTDGFADQVAVDQAGRPWVSVDQGGAIYLATVESSAGPALRSGNLQVQASSSQAVACPFQETSPNVFTVTCANQLSVPNLTGTINSERNYTLASNVSNLSTVFAGIPAVVDLVNSNLFTGINTARVQLTGPDNGATITITSTVGFGAAFDEFDQAIQGISGVSFKAKTYPVTATLRAGVTSLTVVLHDGAPMTFTAPETGTTFSMRRLWLTYNSNPRETNIYANTTIKLSSLDANAADLDINYRKVGSNVLIPSGKLRNLSKPFGVIPITITEGDFTARLKDSGGKKLISAMSINATNARLLDTLTLTGGFAFDKDAQTFSLNATYRMCGQNNTLAVQSSNPQAIPGEVLNIVNNLGKTLTSCVQNATCPSGYTKTGLQCDRTCPAGSNNTPGICDFGFGSIGGCPAPLSGLKPSCINPDNAKPLIWPQ